MAGVQTGCGRCRLDVADVDWMWQMWTGCGTECGQVDVAGVDRMWAVGPCGLDVSSLDWLCKVWTGQLVYMDWMCQV